MQVSLQAQVLIMRRLCDLSVETLRKLFASRAGEAELLKKQLDAAADTLALCHADDRVRTYIERQQRDKR